MEILIVLVVIGLVVFGLVKLLKVKLFKPKLTVAQKEYKVKLSKKPNNDRVIGMPAYGLVKKYGKNGVYGEKSEIATALSLSYLTKTHKGLYVFNNVQVTPQWDIDHIVLAGDTMILIDTKNWKGKSSYSVRKDSRTGDMSAMRDGSPFPGNSIKMNYYVKTLKKMYPKFDVVGVMNIDAYGANVNGVGNGFHFINFKELNSTIKQILGREQGKQSASSKTLVAVKSLASKTTKV